MSTICIAGWEDGKKEVIWRNLILDIFVRQVGFLEKEFVRGGFEKSRSISLFIS